MGDHPCPVVPVPKEMKLAPSDRAWPKAVRVRCDALTAKPVVNDFENHAGGGSGDVLTIHLIESRCRPEGYEAVLREDGIQISAADCAGFRHALQTLVQLAPQGALPTGRICDWPALSIRGFHLNFANMPRLTGHEAVRLIETAARFKLNTVLCEYGPRFPFEANAAIRSATALTSDDVGRINGVAAARGIQIIPLQQSLAHLAYALKHDHLAHLRERPERANLMCPNDPGSLGLFQSLATEIIEGHPGATMFHLGGDEARKIGNCPRCAPLAKEKGKGPACLYGRHIGAAARWLLGRGLRPIAWDDTFCAYPAAFEHLPKETIIAYWDYIAVADPTPVLIPRMAHAAGGPRVAHDWQWSLASKRGRVSDVQAAVMKAYSRPVRLRSALGADYIGEFGPYLGTGFPKWVRALPYLEYYQDRGHEVITSPTGLGNGDTADGVPNFERFEHNIRTHAQRCRANGKALGLITTAWHDMPVEVLYQPLLRTAQCAW